MYRILRNFFWFCSGANTRILEENDIDHNKYFAIGATIFFTAVFAGISAGYAIYFVFSGSSYAFISALLFGLVWGLAIFNIDRFLVMSIRKENKPLKEFFFALPRILLAIMIGIVIARPLELKIFEKEINEGLKQYYIENEQEISEAKTAQFSTQYKLLIDELALKRVQKDTAYNNWQKQMELRDKERFGTKTDRTTGKPGWGKETDKLQLEVEAKKGIYDSLDFNVRELEKQIEKARNESGILTTKNLDDKALDALVKNAGFYDRNKILGQISSWSPMNWFSSKDEKAEIVKDSSTEVRKTQNRFDGEEDGTVFFISMLFIFFETLPILVKLMSNRSTYDVLLEHEEDRANFTKQHESVAHKRLIRSMALAQRDVLDKAIEDWRGDELSSNDLNERYINNEE